MATHRRRPLLIVATLVVAATAAGLSVYFSSLQEPAQTATDLRGNPVQLDPGATPNPEQNAVDDIGDRLMVPAVGLDAPIGELTEIEGEITPPGFQSAYYIRNRGASIDTADTGTVYLVTHSLRNGGTAPGNYLFDVRTGTVSATVGDVVLVGNQEYVIETTEIVDKEDLPGADIWNEEPGRLVLITCLQTRSNKPSTQNVVITARLAS